MESRIWLRVPAICELTGFSKHKLLKDARRFNWPSTTYFNSPVKLYAADAIEHSYGIKFQSANVSIVANKLNRISVFVERAE